MFELIGETLRRLRRERGLTLQELGGRAELGRGQLSRIENYKQEATLSTLAKILASQGVSRREFFRRYDLVESEVLAVEREKAATAASPGQSPQELQELVGRLETFLQSALHPTATVAQGAIEVGDLLVLFRVVPRGAAPGEPPPAAGGEEKPARRGRAAGGRKRKR
ncbi:MAG TPA: helix-turn-helix domain-containing protein [Thermoanaerobaculia bacterium]|nr:helix-turn-helix domain-containing protein [Thermoanaerobaculia bacterium]